MSESNFTKRNFQPWFNYTEKNFETPPGIQNKPYGPAPAFPIRGEAPPAVGSWTPEKGYQAPRHGKVKAPGNAKG